LGLGTEVKRSLGNHLLVLVLLADQASANLALEVHNGLLGRLLTGGGLGETEEGGAVVGAVAVGFFLGIVSSFGHGVLVIAVILPVVQGVVNNLLRPRGVAQVKRVAFLLRARFLFPEGGGGREGLVFDGCRTVDRQRALLSKDAVGLLGPERRVSGGEADVGRAFCSVTLLERVGNSVSLNLKCRTLVNKKIRLSSVYYGAQR